MSGDHRAPPGHPVLAARKSARWMIALLTVVALIAALLGLVMYLIFFASSLERWGFIWVLAVIWSIRAFARPARGPAYLRWLAPSLLLAASWNVLTAFASQRSWPPGQQHSLALAGYGVGAVAAALFCAALVTDIRSGGLRWRRPPAAPSVTPPR
ncbi:MAG: hypothetical protein ACLP70_24880 [Streptosporangiaceae bacterium]